jgi:hypothetical protein
VREVIRTVQQRRRPGLAIRHDPAHRDAAETHPVIRTLPADEPRARALAAHAMEGERDLERRVHGLGARVGEEHVIEPRRGDLHERVRELERHRVRHLK